MVINGHHEVSTQVYRWLSAIVPEANYMAALNARFENTGDWFLGGERFLRWKFESDSFLWVCGTSESPGELY